jgi:hypothetical protein
MLLRLGVAARYTTAPRARARLRTAAAPLRAQWRDWGAYGDAFLGSFFAGAPPALRASVQMLYAEGGPWHDRRW